ncbi:MAG: hypothetical protein M1608_16140 [Candidatus Omnitrophica bacterium]|nr:hypothetical protein [Candidatus Omnitrophota bacterium]
MPAKITVTTSVVKNASPRLQRIPAKSLVGQRIDSLWKILASHPPHSSPNRKMDNPNPAHYDKTDIRPIR